MLTGQIALITGASRGIGAAIALELGKQGAIVIGTATSDSGAASISSTFAAANIKGEGMALNVNDAEQIDATLKVIAEKYGDVSVLVNNAGITRDTLLMRMKDDDWDAVISTNLTSVFHHLNLTELYREFRTSDVELERWDRMEKTTQRLRQAFDFLYY